MHVYAIQHPGGLVKIGRTSKPNERLRSIQYGGGFSAVRVWVSSALENSSAVETEAHKAAQANRVDGEWFSISFTDAVSVISSAIESYMPIQQSKQCPIKADFSSRLNRACDNQGVPERGRRLVLAKLVGVSGEAARKWLSGEAMPAMNHVSVLASHLKVNAQWLLTGKNAEEMSPADTILSSLSPEHQAQALRMLKAFAASCRTH